VATSDGLGLAALHQRLGGFQQPAAGDAHNLPRDSDQQQDAGRDKDRQ